MRVVLVRCSTSENWHSHARWRSHLSVLPMIGGVAIFNICNTSDVGMLVLHPGCPELPNVIVDANFSDHTMHQLTIQINHSHDSNQISQ